MQPILLLHGAIGALDQLAGLDKNLPNAQLAVLPNTAHPIEMVNTDKLVYELKAFLQ